MTYTIQDIKIFIPTFNRPDFLRESIRSLVKQTAGCPDITVYNNGTLAETSDVIKEFEIYGIKEVKSKGGLLECMESVQEFIDTPFVMFFHDDDVLNCKYLEYALKALNTYENVSFVTSKYCDFTDYNCIDFTPAREEHYLFTSKKQFAEHMYLYERVAMQPTIYRTDLFKKYPREKDKYGKFFDWPYLVTLSGLGNVVLFSDLKMFNVRHHGGQWTNDESTSWTVPQVINWHKQFAEALEISDENSTGYKIFYPKFHDFITGGYYGLICEKYKKTCDYDDFLKIALKKLDINFQKGIYNKPWVYQVIQKQAVKFHWRENFESNIMPENPISTEDLTLDKIQDLQNIVNVILQRQNEILSDCLQKPKSNFVKTLSQSIFSVKNDSSRKYKVITILGIKIKFKKKIV